MLADWRGPQEGHKDDQRAEEPALRGMTEAVRTLLPGEEVAQPHHSIPVLKGLLQQRMEGLSSEGATWRGQGVQVALGDVSSGHKKCFYS